MFDEPNVAQVRHKHDIIRLRYADNVIWSEVTCLQVAAEAMDGYLMFDHRIKARVS